MPPLIRKSTKPLHAASSSRAHGAAVRSKPDSNSLRGGPPQVKTLHPAPPGQRAPRNKLQGVPTDALLSELRARSDALIVAWIQPGEGHRPEDNPWPIYKTYVHCKEPHFNALYMKLLEAYSIEQIDKAAVAEFAK